MYQGYYGLIHHLGSPPWIGLLSLGYTLSAGDSIGLPSNPSYIPDVLLSYGDHMTFYERLMNSIMWLRLRQVFLLISRKLNNYFVLLLLNYIFFNYKINTDSSGTTYKDFATTLNSEIMNRTYRLQWSRGKVVAQGPKVHEFKLS